MNEWIHFEYREFYDIPRMVVLTYKGRILLLDSSFDEKKDEYSENYIVYELPKSSLTGLNNSWDILVSQAIACLGEIPTKRINFDPTRRQKLEANSLQVLGL